MRPKSKIMALACALTLGGLSTLGYFGRAGAQEQPKTAKSARGGALAKTARHQFEVFCYTTGLRVFPMDASGAPVDAAKLTGTATFFHPNSPKPWFLRALSPAAASPGQASGSLDLYIGLDAVPPTGAKVAFEIAGLPDTSEPTATFEVPLEFVKATAAAATPRLTVPAGSVTASPRYVYGPGYYGYGYYQYAGPQTAPAQISGPVIYGYSTPGQYSSGGTVGPGHRDWSTGRNNGLAKPWMRAMD